MGEGSLSASRVNSGDMRIIDLAEYEEVRVPADQLSSQDADLLYARFSTELTLEEPSRRHPADWVFRSNGYVGFIPVSERLALRLNPKVPLHTLFGMLEWAYKLDPSWLSGLYAAASVNEFYERLAMVLARRVLERARRGLYRRYVGRTEQLAYVCGAIDLREHLRRPWLPKLQCDFEEHSSDVPENRNLAWTLAVVARSGLCSERVRPTVRRAFHAVEGGVTVAPVRPSQCLLKSYDRLCEDYRPMHALCRFFLEHAGAAHSRGGDLMLPFLIRMDLLFEKFVASWLASHLPPHLELAEQESLRVGQRDDLEFRIDLIVRDAHSRRALLILDTKYKAPDSPALADIAQVVTYAEGKRCSRSVLVYPAPLARPVHERVGDIWVRSLTFDLASKIDLAGTVLLREVVDMVEGATPTLATSGS